MRHLVWWWFQSGRPLRRSSASTRLSWVLSSLSVSAKYVDIDWNSDYFAQCLHWASLPSLCSQERCLMVRLQTSPVPNSIKSWKLKMPNVLWFFAFLHTHMRLTNYLATLSSSSFRSFILRSNLGSFWSIRSSRDPIILEKKASISFLTTAVNLRCICTMQSLWAYNQNLIPKLVTSTLWGKTGEFVKGMMRSFNSFGW